MFIINYYRSKHVFRYYLFAAIFTIHNILILPRKYIKSFYKNNKIRKNKVSIWQSCMFGVKMAVPVAG